MGQGIEYHLAGVRYPTKKAVAEKARAILHVAPVGVPLGGSDFAFIRSLLSCHHNARQKIGCGVASIHVTRSRRSRHFELVRTDGTATDFSYRSCLMKPTPEADARSAMREAVRPSIEAFRQRRLQEDPRCAFTGEHLAPAAAHVDHDDPFTFRYLVAEFARTLPGGLLSVEVEGGGLDGNTQVWMKDRALREAWIAYHDRWARLRLVRADVNTKVLPMHRRDAARQLEIDRRKAYLWYLSVKARLSEEDRRQMLTALRACRLPLHMRIIRLLATEIQTRLRDGKS